MNRERWSTVYVGVIAVAAVLLGAIAATLWPTPTDMRSLWVAALLVILLMTADRFPIQLSRQATATLSTLPLYMAALLLHPLEAALVAGVGMWVSESSLRAPARAVAFNASVYAAAAALAGIVYFSLRPGGDSLALTGGQMLAAVAAGLMLHAANVLLVTGMLTLRKGLGFWRGWRETYVFEAVQEGGLLTLGLIAALLFIEAWWSIVLVLIPCVLAYYGFKRNVSEAAEKARLAEELEQSLKELKELQGQLVHSAKLASVGTLAAGVAHEINNPVFAITGRAELLLRNPQRHLRSEKALDYATTIFEMGERISRIVRQLLDYSHYSDEAELVDLSDTIESAASLVRGMAESKHLTIIRECDEGTTVLSVSAQLQQIFVNLLTNALDACTESGSVKVGCRRDGATVEAYVEDKGRGIPADLLGKVFEPFFTTKEVGKGTGLGLFVSHKIVTALNGEISIASEVGKGTTVWLKLPAATIREHPPESELAAIGNKI